MCPVEGEFGGLEIAVTKWEGGSSLIMGAHYIIVLFHFLALLCIHYFAM